MILTDEETKTLSESSDDTLAVIRNTEAAVLAKLSQGVVMPEPLIIESSYAGVRLEVFTVDQLRTAIATARVRALEHAAKAIKDAYMEGFFAMETYKDTQLNDEDEAWEESNAIRALKGTT